MQRGTELTGKQNFMLQLITTDANGTDTRHPSLSLCCSAKLQHFYNKACRRNVGQDCCGVEGGERLRRCRIKASFQRGWVTLFWISGLLLLCCQESLFYAASATDSLLVSVCCPVFISNSLQIKFSDAREIVLFIGKMMFESPFNILGVIAIK